MPPRATDKLLTHWRCVFTLQAQAAVVQDKATTKKSAGEIIQDFYAKYNEGDVNGLMDLFAEDCEYHDMIYSEPFHGKEETRAFFAKCSKILSTDLKFVVDGISGKDPNSTGVKW